jgi:sugar phosphate isomerase/epimerase
MNRRNFFASSLAAGATPLMSVSAASAAPVDIKLGIASYSLRNFKLPEAMEALKTLRVKYVKFKLEAHLPQTSTPAQVAEAKKMLADAGIKLTATGNNPMDKVDEAWLRAKVEFNKKLGVDLMTIAPSHESLPLVEKLAKEYDMRMAIHNHGPEDKKFPAPSDVLKAINGMDKRMGLCIDVGHTARAGEDFVAACKKAGPRLFEIDVKDLKNAKEKASQVAVGEGELPIAKMFRTLAQMKFQGVVQLEYEINAKNPLPGMIESVAYMRGIVAGMNV